MLFNIDVRIHTTNPFRKMMLISHRQVIVCTGEGVTTGLFTLAFPSTRTMSSSLMIAVMSKSAEITSSHETRSGALRNSDRQVR